LAREFTQRGHNKYNKLGDTFLSYDRECTPVMLLRVFGCYMYTRLHPRHSKKSLWKAIDMEKDPVAVHFCLSKYLCRRDFNRELEFFVDSVPR